MCPEDLPRGFLALRRPAKDLVYPRRGLLVSHLMRGHESRARPPRVGVDDIVEIGVQLEAPDVPAPALRTLIIDGDMADFGDHVVLPAIEHPVDDHARARSDSDHVDDEIGYPDPGAEPALTKSRDVGVIVDEDAHAELLPHCFLEMDVAPVERRRRLVSPLSVVRSS